MSREEQLTRVREALKTGKPDQANEICRRLLTEEPRDPVVHHLLGLTAQQRGRLDEAKTFLQQAVALQPSFAQAHQSLGTVLQRTGELAEAQAAYRRALELRPDLVMARINLAVLLQQSGKLPQSIQLLHDGVKLAPDRFELQNNLGLALLRAGHPAAAVGPLRKALAAAPQLAVVHRNLASALAGAGHGEEAIERYHAALKIDPDDSECLARLALAERARGNLMEAVSLAERAVTQASGLAVAWRALAQCRRDEGKLAEAEGAAREALRLAPDVPELQLELARILEDSRRRAEAIELYDGVLRQRPRHREARERRREALLGLGRFTEAWADTLLAEPGAGGESGAAAVARWDGTAYVRRTLHLSCPPSLGDSINLVRYAPLAAARGGRVVLSCPTPLLRLFSTLPGIEVRADGLPPATDFQASLPDLPRIFGTKPETIPATIPYLRVDESLARRWAERLAHLPRPRIGLCWRGALGGDDRRFLSLPLLAQPLAGLEASLISLQRDTARQQIAAVPGIFDPKADSAYGASAFEDFADTAALMANLDLVVSVDTANAHLAGALGRPAYLLLPFTADWRWLEDRDDSPWYPSFRLIRQTQPGDWPGVMTRLARALKLWRKSLAV